MKEINQIRLQYIYTWKDAPCVAILNKQKCHIFFFFLYKIGEQEGETGPVWGRRLVPVEGGCYVEKGCGRVDMVQILWTHVCKWKMISVETIPGMAGEGDKGELWRG
jgi:hypothetical protein